MENSFFIKLEIIIFILSFLYILYYLCLKLYKIYFKVKNVVKPVKITNKKTALNKVNLDKIIKNSSTKENKAVKISDINRKNLADIIKKVNINTAKGSFDIAKNQIVEGLSLDKYNTELNMSLAYIYEKEKNYLNAEYIYIDLLDYLKEDFKIMKKLGYIYAMQNKLKESLDIYEKIHRKKMADDEVIDLLSELTYNMKDYKKGLKYTNLFLVSKPRDVEKLFMKAKCMRKLGQGDDSYAIYKRIIELQPYNTRAKDKLIAFEAEKEKKNEKKNQKAT